MPLATLESFDPLSYEPPKFDQFWSTLRDEVAAVDPRTSVTLQESRSTDLQFDHLRFHSLGRHGIHGYLLSHTDDTPRPLIVHSHGYNSQYDVMWHWANTGCHVLGIDFRGFGRSDHCKLAPGSYILTGIESAETSILRGAVADLLQALRVGHDILGTRISNTTLYGFSFGGAIALMAGSLSENIDLLVCGQPTLGWHNERLRLSDAGTGAELRNYLDEHYRRKSEVLETLNYFESMHFAKRLRTPTFVGIGLDDNIVPSRTVIAISNRVRVPEFEVRLLPVSHSKDPRESLWKNFDEEWLGFTRRGLPSDFGNESRRLLPIE